MANDSVRNYQSAADITNFWIKNIMPRYFDVAAINTYRAGTLGYTSDIMSTVTEDSFHAMMVAKREVLPNTAQYLSSLYLHGAARLMDAPMGKPAQANILLMIQQSELLKYGEQDGDLHTFVLDDTFIARVGDIPFMLDYPIKILSVKRDNGKYAHTTHYDIGRKNSLVTSEEKYLPNKMMNYQGTEFLVMSVKMRQLTRTTQVELITSNTIVSTVTKEFHFDGTLANFEVFYKENDITPEVQLIKLMEDSVIAHEPFCWYKVINDSTIRITFPANIYFTPRLNSNITVNIYTTMGEGGNFDSYDSDIISDNDSPKYPYNAQVPVFGTVDGASTNGESMISQEDYRKQVMRAYATNMTFTSENDLQLYFDSLMEGTSDRFKFTKQRDDSFVRLHGAFLRMKDEGNNVVPTNTLDLVLDPQEEKADFDIYSDAVKKFIIKPGALFHYYNDEDHKYVVRRIKDRKLGDDISSYDAEGQWVCGSCGMRYEDQATLPFEDILKDKENEYVCPHCGAAKTKFRKDNFIFCNPYLISVSTDNFMCGYYLNSVNLHKDIRYTMVNDLSIVQFVARHFKIDRNAIAGENFYRFSIAISPSVDIKLETVFEEADVKNSIIAPHNGYVKDISYQDEAVYATIHYEPEPEPIDPDAPLEKDDEGNDIIPEPVIPEEYDKKIQVSSFIRKINKDFMICPTCGKRHTLEEWAIISAPIEVEEPGDPVWDEEKGEFVDTTVKVTKDPLYDSEGVPLPCPQCQELSKENPANLIDYEKKFVDFDYFNGFDMKFSLGDRISVNDVIATPKPKDLGRIRIIMDLDNVMKSTARRYIPMTLETANTEKAPYFIFAAYMSTNDIIDISQLMSVEDGFVMPDGSSGKNHSLAIPIEGLTMEIHAFYEYRDDDELNTTTRNPSHPYSAWPYVKNHTFTNTYTLEENETFTLIKPLDHAKGFLDVFEREDIWEPPDEPDPEPDPDPEPPDPGDHPGEDMVPDDPLRYTFLRTVDHEALMVEEHENDRFSERYLVVRKTPLPTDDKPDDDEPFDPTEPDDSGTVITPTNPGSTVVRPNMPFGGNFMYFIRNCPMVAANWLKQHKNEQYFIERIYERYEDIDNIHARLQNAFAIDMKFYNTYGKSKFYKIGNRTDLQVLDSVNVVPRFGAGIIFPASGEVFRENFANFVREYVEASDDVLGNGRDIYLLNLISLAKANFEEVGFLEYYGINDYDYSAQRIVIMSDDEILQTVSPDAFVPEFLNIVREVVNGRTVPKVAITVTQFDANTGATISQK